MTYIGAVKHHPSFFTKDMAIQLLEALHFKGLEEMEELLKEEAASDFVLRELDTTRVMAEFLYLLEAIVHAVV
jgi:hypothetical protein